MVDSSTSIEIFFVAIVSTLSTGFLCRSASVIACPSQETHSIDPPSSWRDNLRIHHTPCNSNVRLRLGRTIELMPSHVEPVIARHVPQMDLGHSAPHYQLEKELR